MFTINTSWDDNIGGCLNFGPLDENYKDIENIIIERKDGSKESFPFSELLEIIS